GFVVSPDPAVPPSPVVPAAILFDLANGGDKAWGEAPPYRELGRAAVASAAEDFALGTAGAGYGAMAGALKGGTGSASVVSGDGRAGAFRPWPGPSAGTWSSRFPPPASRSRSPAPIRWPASAHSPPTASPGPWRARSMRRGPGRAPRRPAGATCRPKARSAKV